LIRRKTPSSKKTQQKGQKQQSVGVESLDCTQDQAQIKTLTDELSTLRRRVEELAQANKELLSETVALQRMSSVYREVHYELIHSLENQSRRVANTAVSPPLGAPRAPADDLSPHLHRARELLLTLGPPPAPSAPAEGPREKPHPMYPSPADSSTSTASSMFVAPEVSPGMGMINGAMVMPRMGVYPGNQNGGMEAFSSEHMPPMSYSVARDANLDGIAGAVVESSTRETVTPEKTDEWGPRKPHIFLVEDDAICAKIGMKFLKSLGCTVVLAVRRTALCFSKLMR
jgi:osomolarity two-component system response regulator SKN7